LRHVADIVSWLVHVLTHAGVRPNLLFSPEDLCDMFLRNVSWLSADFMAISQKVDLFAIPCDCLVTLWTRRTTSGHFLVWNLVLCYKYRVCFIHILKHPVIDVNFFCQIYLSEDAKDVQRISVELKPVVVLLCSVVSSLEIRHLADVYRFTEVWSRSSWEQFTVKVSWDIPTAVKSETTGSSCVITVGTRKFLVPFFKRCDWWNWFQLSVLPITVATRSKAWNVFAR
jgi:hypothetical protein